MIPGWSPKNFYTFFYLLAGTPTKARATVGVPANGLLLHGLTNNTAGASYHLPAKKTFVLSDHG
jgi:hypothetical protein